VFRKNRLHSTSRHHGSAHVIPSLGALILLTHALAFSAFAQRDPPDQPAAPPAPPVQNAVPQPQGGTSNDHVFDLIPNFLTLENADKAPPLTSGGKFKAVARGVFDWGEFIWIAGVSGVGQWANSEPGFHQGWEGYGKRYGANFADSAIENFMTSAILPSILKQDPRFYQSSHGSFLHRLGYAASRIVITRGDSGSRQFNFSEVFGSAISAGISTYSYHPREDRTVINTASVWGTQVGYDTLSFILKEFWPDIRKKVFHQKQPATSSH
jgi:hypothetical protein